MIWLLSNLFSSFFGAEVFIFHLNFCYFFQIGHFIYKYMSTTARVRRLSMSLLMSEYNNPLLSQPQQQHILSHSSHSNLRRYNPSATLLNAPLTLSPHHL